MEQIQCACGCDQSIPKYDKKGRPKRYIFGHQNKKKTQKQREACTATLIRIRPIIPWNKGLTYVHSRKKKYAYKGAWHRAMQRLFPNKCMRCGWQEAPCDTHHIVPLSKGGENTIENGIILCPNCHRLVHHSIVEINELDTIQTLQMGTGYQLSSRTLAPIHSAP